MSNLISLKAAKKTIGAQLLFREVSLNINKGDKIGIVGPNGSGKSTLLKILCGMEELDSGQLLKQKFVRLSYLDQEDVFNEDASITENLMAALRGENLEETEKYNRIHSLLSRAEIYDAELPVKNLSGGWRKRLAICRSMLVAPDVLVMDEPTNHLDIEGILWLEKMLQGTLAPDAHLLVSHDRQFLETCSTRIIELSAVYPEGTFQVKGKYSDFLMARDEFLQNQREEEDRLANKARREIEWLRRGPKARSTKAKYRIDEAYRLTDELQEVKARNRVLSDVQINFDSTGRKTKKLLEAQKISKSFGDRQLFKDLDITLSPGSRLGLLGRNGCGKSTLMKILAGAGQEDAELPDGGTVKIADNVQIVSFDQNRETIDQSLTLRRALAPDGDSIVFRNRSLHVVSWAKKFLFQPEQLETPVGQLSGGEQARILIAHLMRQPADILLLDEPTNDLDIASLDVLEASLIDFPGALVLVTHDRFLLDRICHRLLGFGGSNGVGYYADYEQWLRDLSEVEKPVKVKEKPKASKSSAKAEGSAGKGRLSYMDQREYDQIEEKLGAAESLVEELQKKMELPEIVSNPAELDECWQKLEAAQKEVDALYQRWDELETKKGG